MSGFSGAPARLEERIRVDADGEVTAFSGKVEFGQGIRTAFAKIVAGELGVPIERVTVVLGDTALVPYDMGTFGSRSIAQDGEILRRAAELISARQMVYGGLMAIEVGKTRLEALGEVEEAADLIRYYSQTAIDNNYYDHPMDSLGDSAVHTRSILRPHGVFAVISPFNFPMALAAGPTGAAMLAGNTVVFKPSSAAPMSGVKLVEA